jgi:hypothetical protein
MIRETPYIGGKATKHPDCEKKLMIDNDAPSTTRYIHVYTQEHITYGQLLTGLEFKDKDE